MPARTHLLDLMELPSLHRRLIQLLLRRGTMLESELRRLIRLLPDGEHLTSAEFDTLLASLEDAGWLIRNTDGDEPRYRVHFSQKTSKSQDAFWERLSLDSIRQQWHIKLSTARETLPAPEDLLMRRGGKRVLSKAIWDKLEDAPKETSPDMETKSRAAKLFDLLDQPKEKPSSDKQDLRKKLWGALGDEGE